MLHREGRFVKHVVTGNIFVKGIASAVIFVSKKAFTLIEIIMAMAIMVVGIIGVVRLLPVGLKASRSSEMLSKAAFLAQEKLEELKLAGLARLVPQAAVPLEGEASEYSWTAEVAEVALDGVYSSADIRQLSLTVSWEEKGNLRSHTFVTYLGR